MNDTIFQPRFDLGPVIEATIESIERSNWLVTNMLLMPKHESWIRREVSVRRAAATTRIEGAGLADEQVSRLAKRGPRGRAPTEDEQANLNALEAYRFVDYLSDQPEIPLDELVIRELNRYFLKDLDETLTPGVYRKGQNKVGDFYMPPDQGDVPDLMRGYALWLRSAHEDLHPVVKAGLAHIHFVAVHPFWDGNGRTARALAAVILQRSPFHFKKLLSLEQFFDGIRRDYIAAIEQALGDHFRRDYDASSWLGFFTNSLLAQAMRLTDELTKWHQNMSELYSTLEALNVNHRQTDGIAYAARTGQITRADYMDITDASPLTASRDLARLVELGLLVPRGRTRGRVYLYAPRGGETREPQPEQKRLFRDGPEGGND